MKINGELVITTNLDENTGIPVVNCKVQYNLDCTEAEHALAMSTFQKISDDWLSIKQEIVKALVCTPSFKEMVSAGWTVVTGHLKKAA